MRVWRVRTVTVEEPKLTLFHCPKCAAPSGVRARGWGDRGAGAPPPGAPTSSSIGPFRRGRSDCGAFSGCFSDPVPETRRRVGDPPGPRGDREASLLLTVSRQHFTLVNIISPFYLLQKLIVR